MSAEPATVVRGGPATGAISLVGVRFTHDRIETIIAVSAAISSVVLGLQAFFTALSTPGMPAEVSPVVLWGQLVVLIACACGYLAPRTRRIAAVVYLGTFVLLLAFWPLLARGVAAAVTPEPWYWYLITVATTAALVAFPRPWPAVTVIALPLLYAAVRIVEGGISNALLIALVFEVSYPLILGGVITILVGLFRSLATRMDAARASTVAAYRRAATAEAEQEERIAFSALMHDSVLAALIAAERACSPREQSLAVSMAREALEGLADGAPLSGGSRDSRPQSRQGVARTIRAGLAEIGRQVDLEVEPLRGEPPVPADVAAAVARAATQAIVNALEHARGIGLRVQIRRPDGCTDDDACVEVVVSDEGPGFDLDTIPADRLGISASIRARVAAVGGSTAIESGPSGTTITMRWSDH